METAVLGLCVALALIFFQIPIAIALALVGFGGYITVNGFMPAVSMLLSVTKESSLAYSLIVLPLFILMGNLVAGTGVSADLFRAAQALLSRRRGGLALSTVMASGGFGAICGSSVATAATIGRIAIPEMARLGYANSLSAAAVAAGGTLGVLIPPSVIMVVYGVATQTHIGKLFAAGVIPGVLGVLGYLLAVKWTVWRNPATAPQAQGAQAGKLTLGMVKTLWPVIAIFVVVMGGIYTGWFTSIEASGVGASAAFLFAIWRHKLGWRALQAIFVDTARTSAVMFGIILGAGVFGEFVNQTGIHHSLLAFVQSGGISPAMVVAMMILVYLLLGCVLESLSLILLTIPIFFPVIIGLGYDPVWFGIVVVVAVEIGLITPPIGINLFVIRSVAPNIPMKDIMRGVVPFVAVDLLRIALIAAVPLISLWLPNRLFPTVA